MKAWKTILAVCCFVPLSCGGDRDKAAKKKQMERQQNVAGSAGRNRKKPLINIPAGAVVTDLTLPYFNEERKRVSLLTIETLKVKSDGSPDEETLLAGESLKLWLFDDEGAIRTTTTMSEADYLVERELLKARGQLLMRSANDEFAAQSNGGVFSLETGQALLLGPASTRFVIPKDD
ncbi:MAG: hypothetical protein PVJ98_05395 [Akkermansiaceae bacterium]|jgi:hypothetical protein